jgi:hypothetical protein
MSLVVCVIYTALNLIFVLSWLCVLYPSCLTWWQLTTAETCMLLQKFHQHSGMQQVKVQTYIVCSAVYSHCVRVYYTDHQDMFVKKLLNNMSTAYDF